MSQAIEQLQRLNAFLEAFYQTPRRLSDILRDAGLSEQEIAYLRSQALEPYLTELLQRWQTLLPSLVGTRRRADILIRRYGLNHAPALLLQQLGDSYGLSRERIRQLQVGALRRLCLPKHRQTFEQIALEAAQALLRDCSFAL